MEFSKEFLELFSKNIFKKLKKKLKEISARTLERISKYSLLLEVLLEEL